MASIREKVEHLSKKNPIIRRIYLFLKNKYRKLSSTKRIPHGKKGIKSAGHRKYIGGKWDEIGELQKNFLIERGLDPDNILLDIGCGSLRLGSKIIPYLNRGNYLGIDKEKELINKGIKHELGKDIYNKKEPIFVVSSNFDFGKFKKSPDYVIAQSLFTHMPRHIIIKCFKSLSKNIDKEGVFYATFFESEKRVKNPKQPHDHKNFEYTKKEILEFGLKNGWRAKYIGDWGHPRGQIIAKYWINDSDEKADE